LTRWYGGKDKKTISFRWRRDISCVDWEAKVERAFKIKRNLIWVVFSMIADPVSSLWSITFANILPCTMFEIC
jgi:hypothetical protein